MKGPRIQNCLACDGKGYDRCPETSAKVKCEGCEGSGYLADCAECSEPMPLPYAERHGVFCGACAAMLDMGDADAERARLRRSA